MNEPYAEQLNWDKYVLPKNMKKCCLYINFNTELTYLHTYIGFPLHHFAPATLTPWFAHHLAIMAHRTFSLLKA